MSSWKVKRLNDVRAVSLFFLMICYLLCHANLEPIEGLALPVQKLVVLFSVVDKNKCARGVQRERERANYINVFSDRRTDKFVEARRHKKGRFQ